MCLSSVYADSIDRENLLLANVQRIECEDGYVVLTDVLERQQRVKGRLAVVDLVKNTVTIQVER